MKAPYSGITKKEYEKSLKESRVVPTFVNDAYVKQSKSMLREIEGQHRRKKQ